MKKVFIILNAFLLIIALSCASSSSLQNDSSSFNFINLKNVRGAQKVDIYRRNLTNKEETDSCKISSPYKKGYKVMDYFTNPGEEYSYKVLYYKGSKILKTDEITIESKNGVGEIDTPNNIHSTFNSSFGTMTTSNPTSFTKTINDFLKPKYDDGWMGDKSFEAIYTSNDNNELKVEIPLLYTWDCSKIIKEMPDLYNKELKREYVIGFIYLYKDNIHNLKYYQLIDEEKSKDVPMNITINNIDKSFTVTQLDEGLQINIPFHLKGFTKVSINKKE